MVETIILEVFWIQRSFCGFKSPGLLRRFPASVWGRSPDVILLTSIVTACGRATEGSHAVEVFEELKRYRIEATVCLAMLDCWWLKSGKLTSWGNGSFSHYLQGFSTIPGGAGFQPSTGVQQAILFFFLKSFFWFVVFSQIKQSQPVDVRIQ